MNSYVRFTLFLSFISGSLGQYCPDSWKQYRTESCFKLVQQAVTKDNAVAVCAIEDSSSSLASIKSDPLQKFITKYVYEEQASTQNVWIGGVRTPDGTGFTWADKEPLEFTNWEQGRPNITDRTKRCMQINVNSGTWRDVDCASSNQVLCQLDLPWTVYSKQIKALQDRIVTLETELAEKASETELGEVKTTVESIMADYVKTADIEAVQTDLEIIIDLKANQSSLEELDSGLRNYVDTGLLLKADKVDLEGIQRFVYNLDDDLKDLTNDFEVVKANYVDKQSFIDEASRLETSIGLKANQIDLETVNSTLAGVKTEVEALASKLGDLTGDVTLELADLNQEVSNLKASDNATNEAIDILRDNVNEKANQADLVALNTSLSTVKAKVKELDTKLGDLTGDVTLELAALNVQVLDLQASDIGTNVTIDTLRDNVDQKANQIDLETVNSTLAHVKTEVKALATKLSDLTGDVAPYLAELKEQVLDLQASDVGTNATIDTLRENVNEQLDDKANKSQVDAINGIIVVVQNDLSDINDTLTQVSQDYVKADIELQAEADRLEGLLNSKADQSLLNKNVQDLKDEDERINNTLGVVETVVTNTNSIVSRIGQDFVGLKFSVDTHTTNLTELDERVKALEDQSPQP